MTTPKAPGARGRKKKVYDPTGSDSSKARLLLAFVCVWPLILTAILSGNADRPHDLSKKNNTETAEKPALRLRKLLDRVDVVGYGPTHPRVAAVVVGDSSDSEKVITTVESIFRNTDWNRLFLVCVVINGVRTDGGLVNKLHGIEQNANPHRHGSNSDVQNTGEKGGIHDNDDRPSKIHTLFSKEDQGTAASRGEAVEFIDLLAKKHIKANLKSPDEDLILLLIRDGAELTSKQWLSPVTSALIVPPPLMGVEDTSVALKLANAVSFGVEGDDEGKAFAFDYAFQTVMVEPSAKDMALSNGESFPSPGLDGLATAMRLDTYRQLPSQDPELTDEAAANLDLSLNLWLCADGIDVLRDVSVKSGSSAPLGMVQPQEAARFAAAWMDEVYSEKVFESITKIHKELTRLEWETMMSKARSASDFTPNLQTRCRSFEWYANEVNPALDATLETAREGEKKAKEEEEKVVKAAAKAGKGEEESFKIPPEAIREDTDAGNVPKGGSGAGNGGERRKPSKPLAPNRLEIIRKATPIDIAYEDVANGHKDHPHKGALKDNGEYGYIHDETYFVRNPPKFDYPNMKQGCAKRDGHYRMLTEKVHLDFEGYEAEEKAGKKHVKIMCMIYSSSLGHDRIPNVLQTWGQKCDGFMVASNLTDTSVGAVNLPHEGPEEYNNIYQKVRSMWAYAYDNYYEKYDWFHIGGDDLFLLMENLKLYLESEEILTAQNGGIYLPNGDERVQTPMFLGRRFAYQGDMDDIFNSGGSGYTLNKAAVKTLVVHGFPKFMPHAHTFSEDTMVARVLRKLGVHAYDTKDDQGGERYMPFLPGHHLGYVMPDDPSKDWYARYSIDIKTGLDHCSAQSVAFHYAKGDIMKRMHAILYKMCPAP